MRTSLDAKAALKGYDTNGADSTEGGLHAFLSQEFPGHALGEIVSKCVRYKRMGLKEDLVKIASWAFLVWKEAQKQ